MTMTEEEAAGKWVVMIEKDRFRGDFSAPRCAKLSKITPNCLFAEGTWGGYTARYDLQKVAYNVFDDKESAESWRDLMLKSIEDAERMAEDARLAHLAAHRELMAARKSLFDAMKGEEL